jgi:xanthine dehydrogenase YagT iron-sulfur-binding subunit
MSALALTGTIIPAIFRASIGWESGADREPLKRHAERSMSIDPDAISRRAFLIASSVALATVGSPFPDTKDATSLDASAANTPSTLPAANTVTVNLVVNGEPHRLELDSRSTLLDTLRERLGLQGTKKGCDHGQCGACTVHVDGRRVVSCLTLAVQANDRKVTTIEGVTGAAGSLHPMQQAFVDHDALQCGYCTPGQIMSAIACVEEGHTGTADEIREYMSGNLCRCGAYVGILAAIQQVAGRKARS